MSLTDSLQLVADALSAIKGSEIAGVAVMDPPQVVWVFGPRHGMSRRRVFVSLTARLGAIPRLILWHGCAGGVDSFAAEWADATGIPIGAWPANWVRFGRSAGARRTANLVAALPQSALVLWLRPFGWLPSPGSLLSSELAARAGHRVIQVLL